MNENKFTPTAEEALRLAQEAAGELGHGYVGTEHLLLGLMREDEGMAHTVLTEAGLTDDLLTEMVRKSVGAGLPGGNPAQGLTPRAKHVVEIAMEDSIRGGYAYIGTEHLLAGILREGNNMAVRILRSAGVDARQLYTALMKKLTAAPRAAQSGDSRTPAAGSAKEDGKGSKTLAEFTRDLTADARTGKLDPVIGRDDEIQRVIQILSRRTKNNPCLIGEPGVGKTAIAEGLARKIAMGDVPENLLDKKLLSLDLSGMVAGTKYRGEFEERIKKVMQEVQKNGNIILFIDELHTIVGAGKTEGSMDAGNLLKPMLARGELHCIGATTLDEYRKYIEKDAALERRFQPVQVDEPTVEDTISILRGLKERYEVYHGVRIHDNAIVAAATLSNRYISDRFLPDKAIDLVDEACALIRTEIDSMPAELDDMRRKIMQLEIEETALKKETDKLSQDRLAKLTEELANLKDEFNEQKSRWEAEKGSVDEVKKLKSQIEQMNADIENAQLRYEYETAAKLKYSDLPALEKKLEEAEKLSEERKASSMVHDTVTEEEIAGIVAKWTGIPVSKLLEGEREKLLNLDKVLHKSVIGQDEAVQKVTEAIWRSRAGIGDPNRPIGSFMFLGPTGVGKTELAKALARCLFDDEHNMVRIDMTEYMEKFSVSRLIGAPPGYVGYDEGGQLTEAVRRKPYSVVLFDEIEKAHPDVFNILLQILDDGRVTDSQGRTVDFKNTIIIMTSNLGSQYLLEGINDKGEIEESARQQVLAQLHQQFRPEFLNRLDEIICFKPLTKTELNGIIDILTSALRQRLEDKSLGLEITDSAKQLIIDRGFDPVFGARPLKRYLQSTVETLIARAILAGDMPAGHVIKVDVRDGELVCE